MDFIKEQGELAWGSRLRRLSDTISSQAAAVYQRYGLDFDPKCFPVFRLLSEQGPLAVTDVADKLGVSHPAVIQVARELERRGLVVSEKSTRDARVRLLNLSDEGREKLPEFQQIWQLIREVNEHLIRSQKHNILWAAEELESALSTQNYLSRFTDHLKTRQQEAVEILDFRPEFAADFKRLNVEWISNYFVLEAQDLEQLDHPEEIIHQGGHILLARLDGEIVGTAGLEKDPGEASFALIKMAVSERVRGKQVGRKLGLAAIEWARRAGAKSLWLESNTGLTPALTLYRSLGFYKVNSTPTPFTRSNIKMQLDL